MAQFPALPLWTDAYLSDTRHLTQSQHGAYLLLLMTAWRTEDCSLPDDDNLLARFAGTDMRAWKAQKPIIMQFFVLGGDGRWRQKRLTQERAYLVDKTCKRAKAGRAGGIASAASKSLKNNETGQANVDFCLSKTEAPTPTPTPINPPTPRNRGSESDHEFQRFWSAYPRLIAKEAARKKWIAAVKHSEPEQIIAAAAAFADECRAKSTPTEYIPHPSTWLNQQRWNDFQAEQQAPPLLAAMEPSTRPTEDDETWKTRAEQFHDEARGGWRTHWGPDLLSRDCRVPPHLLHLFH